MEYGYIPPAAYIDGQWQKMAERKQLLRKAPKAVAGIEKSAFGGCLAQVMHYA